MDEFLTEHGWTLECKSPLEISHEDGSFATGLGTVEPKSGEIYGNLKKNLA